LEFPEIVGIRKLWRCLRDPTFSRLGTVPACDGQTDRRKDTQLQHIQR